MMMMMVMMIAEFTQESKNVNMQQKLIINPIILLGFTS